MQLREVMNASSTAYVTSHQSFQPKAEASVLMEIRDGNRVRYIIRWK